MILVKDLYNELAIVTGFPLYTNDTDTPDTQRLLLQVLSNALSNVIDGLYITNNVFERTDTITTMAGENQYGIEGIIKNIQIKGDNGKYKKIHYLNDTDFYSKRLEEKQAEPCGYVIRNGYLQLYPVPDKEYEIQVVVSTTDLVLADDDTSRSTIKNINDMLLCNERFAELVVLRAAQLLFAKANNNNTQIYASLVQERLKTFIEHDYKSIEAKRVPDNKGGHYNPRKGLLG